MRWLMLAFVLSVSFTVFVVMAAVTSGPTAAPDDFRRHAPESDHEKAAAGVALAYFRGLLREDPDAVCRTVGEPLTTSMRCRVRPQIPPERQVVADGHLRVTHISLEGTEGFAWISGVNPGPSQRVSLRQVGKVWRVIDNDAFALA